jgi:8-oxo-dGTP diphosphatase
MGKKVGVAGVIPRGETVLVLRRSTVDRFLPGAYDLPGGGLEPGEPPEEAIIREVLEETGLDASIVRKLGTRNYILSDSGEKDKTMVVYLLKVRGNLDITLSNEHDEYRWVSDSGLDGIFGRSDLMRDIIHEYFATKPDVLGRPIGQ